MKLVLIDDDPIVSSSLKMILQAKGDCEVAAIGGDGREALGLYKEHNPDIMLMDIRMKDMNGIDAGREVLAYDSSARIIFLTTFVDDEYIEDALTIGAMGYILKQDFANIGSAIQAVMNDQMVFGQDIVSKIQKRTKSSRHNIPDNFTQTEMELVRLVADGLSNKEIAHNLGFSEGTIRNYLSVILEKLDLRDRTQLAIYYYKNIAD
ncbi:response regulator transcription factor [Erysipelothrix sp. HDW6C]|uniref:response regulator transcription factor n=1 Tax=Erysipelothrix sp. HDW6C TaxID=2714930 RepID=UPI0014082F8D|nr:response regulator transcription factor [Erysipelothrix sp. HDW6C]QIK69623.1 response regulator transcription factor [Erysipelothrix sp. HDW6C]